MFADLLVLFAAAFENPYMWPMVDFGNQHKQLLKSY
jgi:hypothetical protein